jgi:hypothetical protein
MNDITNDDQGSSINPSELNRIISLQEQELMLRMQELELRKQTDNNNLDYAKAALDARVQDLKDERQHAKDIQKNLLSFFKILGIVFFIFLGIALSLNKDEIVKEIIKAIIYIGAGGSGGYFYGKSKGSTNIDQENKN